MKKRQNRMSNMLKGFAFAVFSFMFVGVVSAIGEGATAIFEEKEEPIVITPKTEPLEDTQKDFFGGW